ncbi:MAG: long-chain fatty acid--CoA ligase [Duodenibacillus sp.]|nr:long-chain fatty acid--CoA ligase [Sutterella sp.]MDY3273015.1 long-chain fatty acid--CoA ligase [Duodenibacillus sp.]
MTQDTSATRLEDLKKCKTLCEFVPLRARQIPQTVALRQYDRKEKAWKDVTYASLDKQITAWRRALEALHLERGARVAILLNNSVDAVLADQAVLANGLIPVPLHAIDTPGSSAFILIDSQSSALITNKADRWGLIEKTNVPMPDLKHIILTEETGINEKNEHRQILSKDIWLASGKDIQELPEGPKSEDLAAIVYTSGTTGRPKGVMLTHHNVVENVIATLIHIAPAPKPGYIFLSFLPLSHTFERTAGYYLALGMGCTITYNRSIMLLAEDLRTVKPDVLISVPRIYEKIYARINEQLGKKPAIARWLFNCAVNVGWRKFCAENKLPVPKSPWQFADSFTGPILKKLVADKVLEQFGGNLKVAIAGGAALNGKVARVFGGLGLAPIQGYGMTEASPIIAGNSLTLNQPDTVGKLFPNLQMRLAPETHEIQIRGSSIMKGYWKRPEDTARVLDSEGWLSTGDVGEINETGLLRIKGRIKEIIVTSTGEKVPPVDLELALETDPLFSQAYVVGENKPFISAVTVLNPEEWKKLAAELKVSASEASLKLTSVRTAILKRVKAAAADFPHYALPRKVLLTLKPWTIENGLLTPTLKLKRTPLAKFFKKEIDEIYEKHDK